MPTVHADPRLTDYDLLLENIRDLRAGKAVEVPIYDFKQSKRTGFRRVPVPASRVVIVEGIYALASRIRCRPQCSGNAVTLHVLCICQYSCLPSS